MTRVSTILLFTVLLACIVAMGLAGTKKIEVLDGDPAGNSIFF